VHYAWKRQEKTDRVKYHSNAKVTLKLKVCKEGKRSGKTKVDKKKIIIK